MEDDFNILGNFENLSSANILKKLGTPTSSEASSAKALTTEEDFDFSNFENNVYSGKREKKTSGKGTSSKLLKDIPPKDKASIEEKDANNYKASYTVKEAPEDLCVARRTRSSGLFELRDSNANASSKRKNTNKQEETNKKTSRSSNLSNNQNLLSNELAPTMRSRSQRGRKKSTPSTSVNPSVASVDIIDIVDIVDNEPGSSRSFETARSTRAPNGPFRDVMRARRNYIAERAARCTTVDFVDLITSPMPRIEGVIDVSLDSDEDEKAQNSTINPPTMLDASFDEENPEILVKVIWKGVAEVFPLRKYQKFENIFEKLAARETVEKNKVFLNLDSKIISPNDTPASINYKIFQFIYGRAMTNPAFLSVSAIGKKKRDPNLLTLKVQSDKWKHPLRLELYKTEKFKNLIIKCAEELKMPYEKIKLSFDGEPLQHNQTPTDLEFEGGEVLEIHLKDNP